METVTLSRDELKQVVKEALVELLAGHNLAAVLTGNTTPPQPQITGWQPLGKTLRALQDYCIPDSLKGMYRRNRLILGQHYRRIDPKNPRSEIEYNVDELKKWFELSRFEQDRQLAVASRIPSRRNKA